ncbi:hypothetical protein [Pandoraea apista]|uniref:Holin n=1 Tax=Pandoraea apista TaxID=93218 RepID=A0ABX9ZTQ2_9BURK|nr:hypothetical protein [Pandoraea apista]PTE02717.1 hypothetical protein C7830_00380 [Pandoraea apista]RRJ24974.1 hypothetical protein EIB05_24405 [Pandoraea apista]RRJ71728.1 hypothetical protein EIL82_24305 [Pandoraea apista]RSC95492.1 hypothetical protein EJB12_25440 [Pandoraea apista]RSD06971.1 hypothetical protein EIZ52_25520 [Pandoraea apista]
MKWRIGLADGWQHLHKRGTVIFSAAVGAIAPLAEVARQTWGFIPDDLKEYLPTSLKQAISISILCLTFIALRYTGMRRSGGENANGQ